MKYTVKVRSLLKLKEGDELAIKFEGFEDLPYGKAILGEVVEAEGDLSDFVNSQVLIPMSTTLSKLESNETLVTGDIIAIKHMGMNVGKSGKMYNNILYTVYHSEDDKPPF